MKLLIIGCGSIGKRHLGNLQSLGAFDITVVDLDQARLKEIADNFGVNIGTDLAAALDAKPDAVFICSPNHKHMEQALLSAKAGCNIFVEKPISHNFDQMGELVSLLNKNKLHFFMGSNWKFHPAFKKMKEVIDSKILGRILSFTVIFGQYLPDWHPWEDYRKGYSANKRLGGGILLDSHEFDYIQWFLGPIRTVAGFCGKHTDLEIDTEDIAEAIVKLESGAIGNIHVDYLQRPYRRSFYFYGEQGSMEWDFSSNEIKVYKLDKKEWEITRIDPSYELNQMYKDEISHFLNILAGKEASLSNIEDAVRILKVIEAVKNSSKEGIVVTL